jgi:hypothetical protein
METGGGHAGEEKGGGVIWVTREIRERREKRKKERIEEKAKRNRARRRR